MEPKRAVQRNYEFAQLNRLLNLSAHNYKVIDHELMMTATPGPFLNKVWGILKGKRSHLNQETHL